MAFYTFNHNGLPPDNPPMGEMPLAAAQAAADAVCKKVRGTTCQVKDTTGAVVYTGGPFAAISTMYPNSGPA